MAIIYSKTTATTPEQCLILGVREALVYPFDLGTWTEIRVGLFVSPTHATGDGNVISVDESVGNPAGTTPKSNFYIGLKDSGSALPNTFGANYIGWGNGYGSAQPGTIGNGLLANHVAGNVYYPRHLSNNTTATTVATNFEGIFTTAPHANIVNTTSYASRNIFRVVMGSTPGGKSTIIWQMMNNLTNHVAGPYTAEVMRQYMLSSTFEGGNYPTGYWTTSLSPTGDNLTPPNALFIYVPFFNNRIRIHGIVIEKYS